MSDRTFTVYVQTAVEIVVRDPDVIRRPVENVDGWRDSLYDLKTEGQVIEHLAYNAAVNDCENGLRLDGWADLPEDALSMRVLRSEFEVLEIHESEPGD